MVITTERNVYAFGSNQSEKLGIISPWPMHPLPEKVPLSEVKFVSCGDEFTLFYTEEQNSVNSSIKLIFELSQVRRRCLGITKKGTSCQLPPMKGSEYCYHHQK
jgi:hypothetical protein